MSGMSESFNPLSPLYDPKDSGLSPEKAIREMAVLDLADAILRIVLISSFVGTLSFSVVVFRFSFFMLIWNLTGVLLNFRYDNTGFIDTEMYDPAFPSFFIFLIWSEMRFFNSS